MLKGIILAGGANKRLYPLTLATCKQLLPVYDKPMIFYPLSTLLERGCREILIITRSEQDQASMIELLPQATFGVKLVFAVQHHPAGLADAFRIADSRHFLSPGDCVMLILGDNFFHGAGFSYFLSGTTSHSLRAKVFFHRVPHANRYGVAEFNADQQLVRIIEKPVEPPSDWAQVGLYVYDYSVVNIVRDLKPSARGELEITDVNNTYLEMDALTHHKLPDGTCWFDMGTPEALLDTGQYVATIQNRQGTLVGCPAMAALKAGLTDIARAEAWAERFQNDYGERLRTRLSPEYWRF